LLPAEQGSGRGGDGPARAVHVVDENGRAVPNVPDHPRGLHGFTRGPGLANDRDRPVQERGVAFRELDRSKVGRDHDGVVRKVLGKRRSQDRHGGNGLNRYAEHRLETRGVGVDDEQPVNMGGAHEISDDARAHGLARGPAAVLARVPEIGHHGSRPGNPGPVTGIGQEQELEEVLVRGRPRRLDQVDVRTAELRRHDHVQLAVGEVLDPACCESTPNSDATLRTPGTR